MVPRLHVAKNGKVSPGPLILIEDLESKTDLQTFEEVQGVQLN